MSFHDVATAIREMPSGTHAVLVYDSPENKRDVLFAHMKAGIDAEGLFYGCSEETPQEIRRELGVSGVDVGRLEHGKMLTVKDCEDVYFSDGGVDPPRIISGFSDLAWKYKRLGFRGLRAAGEMSCFFKHGKVEGLLDYENSLHRRFTFPGKGICAYNLVEMGNSDALEPLWPILRAHALVIMTGPNGSFVLEPEKVTRPKIAATMGIPA